MGEGVTYTEPKTSKVIGALTILAVAFGLGYWAGNYQARPRTAHEAKIRYGTQKDLVIHSNLGLKYVLLNNDSKLSGSYISLDLVKKEELQRLKHIREKTEARVDSLELEVEEVKNYYNGLEHRAK